jgi:hypothetical protein
VYHAEADWAIFARNVLEATRNVSQGSTHEPEPPDTTPILIMLSDTKRDIFIVYMTGIEPVVCIRLPSQEGLW